jgi:hypothetical protein
VPPGVTLQTRPVQQSPVAVQVPPCLTQTMPPSWVVVRQRRVPVESGTQGTRPQHSEEVWQVSPGLMQQLESVPTKTPLVPSVQVPEPTQRGRPSVSKAQQATLGSTEQMQSLWALEQALLPPVRRQIPPGTWFPEFCEQTPMLVFPPVAGLHVTAPVSPPQHSLLLVQRLFRILQPSPGWQTFTPVCAQGPQFRLQQLPQPLQRTPSCVHWPAPLVDTSMQTPSVAPEAIEQNPPQQSRSRAQTSPGWMQNDEPSTHLPPLQSPEQQPPATPPSPAVAVQGLPAVKQLVLSAWHLPPVQFPPQQVEEVVQVPLSAVQLVALAQTPALHWRLQQSVATVHELPAPAHLPTAPVHVLAAGSHKPEQHWALVLQATPPAVQLPPEPPEPEVPPDPVLMVLTELLPQLGSASNAARSSANMAAIDRVVGEGFMLT